MALWPGLVCLLGDWAEGTPLHPVGRNVRGNPAAMFADLAAALQPARGAFVQGDRRAVVSLSPECSPGSPAVRCSISSGTTAGPATCGHSAAPSCCSVAIASIVS